jgi:hypothetical protein
MEETYAPIRRGLPIVMNPRHFGECDLETDQDNSRPRRRSRFRRNHLRQDGDFCHLALVGLPPPRPEMPACFAIARDLTHDLESQLISHIEFVQAVAIKGSSRGSRRAGSSFLAHARSPGRSGRAEWG